MGTISNELSGGQNRKLFEFTSGLAHDAHLASYEIAVQKLWADELFRLGKISEHEALRAKDLLDEAGAQIRMGTFPWSLEDEDIHMNLERFVTQHAGDLGKRLHQGRSRNDLIATSLRLYCARQAKDMQQLLLRLCNTALAKAADHVTTFIPGQTHLQFGQPLSLGHILTCYAESYLRAARTVEHARSEALHSLPLGAAALAGTTLNVDGPAMASHLGFTHPCRNSYDAVGDRDFALMLLDAIALALTSLARQCHDIIQWSSTPMGLAILPKAWSTGSSIMPNKRNPDVPELVRARAARAIGRAAGSKTMAHALGTSYASDLHELKKDTIDGIHDAFECLEVFHNFFKDLAFNRERACALLDMGHVLATDVANLVTDDGTPFREAYKTTALLVTRANQQNCQVHELSLGALRDAGLEHLHAGLQNMSVTHAVAQRDAAGGTSPARVHEAIQNLQKELANHHDAEINRSGYPDSADRPPSCAGRGTGA
jgi:argininosuccinate lyase